MSTVRKAPWYLRSDSDLAMLRRLEHTPKPCKVPGCGGKCRAKGYCALHYDRQRRYGDPLMTISKWKGQQIGLGVSRCPRDDEGQQPWGRV